MFISIIFYVAIYCEVKAAGAQLKKKRKTKCLFIGVGFHCESSLRKLTFC